MTVEGTDKIILLVEDNAQDEAFTLRALRKNNIGNEVAVVRDGAEALDYLFVRGRYAALGSNAKPALVLLDLKLPKVDGHEVLRQPRARESTRHLPVVILTSSAEDPDLIESYSFGANSYLRKPVDFQKFTQTVNILIIIGSS